MADYEAAWRRNNKHRASAATRRSRAARLLRQYGAYTDDIDLIVSDQGGICIYCGEEPGQKGLHIEHDHELHARGMPSFRGLSCSACNVAIGALRDDVDQIRQLADRLELLKRDLRDELGLSTLT